MALQILDSGVRLKVNVIVVELEYFAEEIKTKMFHQIFFGTGCMEIANFY